MAEQDTSWTLFFLLVANIGMLLASRVSLINSLWMTPPHPLVLLLAGAPTLAGERRRRTLKTIIDCCFEVASHYLIYQACGGLQESRVYLSDPSLPISSIENQAEVLVVLLFAYVLFRLFRLVCLGLLLCLTTDEGFVGCVKKELGVGDREVVEGILQEGRLFQDIQETCARADIDLVQITITRGVSDASITRQLDGGVVVGISRSIVAAYMDKNLPPVQYVGEGEVQALIHHELGHLDQGFVAPFQYALGAVLLALMCSVFPWDDQVPPLCVLLGLDDGLFSSSILALVV